MNEILFPFVEPTCPTGYHHLGRMSDGRTCFAVVDNAQAVLGNDMCDAAEDDTRSPYLPSSPFRANQIRLLQIR